MPTTNSHPTRRERALRTALGALAAASQMGAEPVEPEQRQAMIREAAYFLAENRGSGAGHELEDWLAAEEQIELALTQEERTAALVS